MQQHKNHSQSESNDDKGTRMNKDKWKEVLPTVYSMMKPHDSVTVRVFEDREGGTGGAWI
jgi:hypothetical protein